MDGTEANSKIHNSDYFESEFEFDFSKHLLLDNSTYYADELFHHGKIRPLDVNCDADSGNEIKNPFPSLRADNDQKSKADLDDNQTDLDLDLASSIPRSPYSLTNSSSSASSSRKKWRLRDFPELFRSASEGSPLLRKCDEPSSKKKKLKKKMGGGEDEEEDDLKAESFGSENGAAPAGVSRFVLAHELHYKMNRAAYEEMRKKTFLPYKQGLFSGCLGYKSFS